MNKQFQKVSSWAGQILNSQVSASPKLENRTRLTFLDSWSWGHDLPKFYARINYSEFQTQRLIRSGDLKNQPDLASRIFKIFKSGLELYSFYPTSVQNIFLNYSL